MTLMRAPGRGRGAAVAGLSLVLLLAVPDGAPAAGRLVRSFEKTSEFRGGELDHMALAPYGRLMLSPQHEKSCDFDEPVAWSVAQATDGTRVYQIDGLPQAGEDDAGGAIIEAITALDLETRTFIQEGVANFRAG